MIERIKKLLSGASLKNGGRHESTQAPRAHRNRVSYIPMGCDQQGRYPQAAEAATDLGSEVDQSDPFGDITPSLLSFFAIGVVVLAVSLVISFFYL